MIMKQLNFGLPENEETNKKNNKEIITAYKIILLGVSGVGKTGIFKRHLNEKFEISYNPTINFEESVLFCKI